MLCMKLFISADIEGVTGIVNWDETIKNNPNWAYFSNQMTQEVKAVCEAAIEAGATEILVKDAHDSARNISPAELPEMVKINRGWSGHPYSMMDGIDGSFDAAIMIGYHNYASSEGNPLSHTMDTMFQYVKLNGEYCNEFMLNSLIANYEGVPVIFVSGDKTLCEYASKINENIKTVTTNEGKGNASMSINPNLAVKKIHEGVKQALGEDLTACKLVMPEKYVLEVCFKDHFKAYRNSFYTGAKQINSTTLQFELDNFFDVLKVFQFGLR